MRAMEKRSASQQDRTALGCLCDCDMRCSCNLADCAFHFGILMCRTRLCTDAQRDDFVCVRYVTEGRMEVSRVWLGDFHEFWSCRSIWPARLFRRYRSSRRCRQRQRARGELRHATWRADPSVRGNHSRHAIDHRFPSDPRDRRTSFSRGDEGDRRPSLSCPSKRLHVTDQLRRGDSSRLLNLGPMLFSRKMVAPFPTRNRHSVNAKQAPKLDLG